MRSSETDCTPIRDRLDPFVDGELAPDEVRRIARHLEACAECREERMRREEELVATVERLVGEEPSAVLPLRVRSSLLTPVGAAPHASRGVRLAPLAAALLLAAFGILFYGDLLPDPTEEPGAGPELALERPVAETIEPEGSPEGAWIEVVLPGDLDGDGMFQLSDFRLLLEVLAHENDEDVLCLAAGDFDGDGSLTVNDSVHAMESWVRASRPPALVSSRGVLQLPCLVYCP